MSKQKAETETQNNTESANSNSNNKNNPMTIFMEEKFHLGTWLMKLLAITTGTQAMKLTTIIGDGLGNYGIDTK